MYYTTGGLSCPAEWIILRSVAQEKRGCYVWAVQKGRSDNVSLSATSAWIAGDFVVLFTGQRRFSATLFKVRHCNTYPHSQGLGYRRCRGRNCFVRLQRVGDYVMSAIVLKYIYLMWWVWMHSVYIHIHRRFRFSLVSTGVRFMKKSWR